MKQQMFNFFYLNEVKFVACCWHVFILFATLSTYKCMKLSVSILCIKILSLKQSLSSGLKCIWNDKKCINLNLIKNFNAYIFSFDHSKMHKPLANGLLMKWLNLQISFPTSALCCIFIVFICVFTSYSNSTIDEMQIYSQYAIFFPFRQKCECRSDG